MLGKITTMWAKQTFPVCNLCLKHLIGAKRVAGSADRQEAQAGSVLPALLGLSSSQIQLNQTHLSEGHSVTMTLSNRPFHLPPTSSFLEYTPQPNWLAASMSLLLSTLRTQ